MSNETANAFETIRLAILGDPEYAWSWHCNLAMTIHDEGVSREQANRCAARLMRHIFGSDTTHAPGDPITDYCGKPIYEGPHLPGRTMWEELRNDRHDI